MVFFHQYKLDKIITERGFRLIRILVGLYQYVEVVKEAVVRRCSVKKVILTIYKIHRKTPVPESLYKVQGCSQSFATNFCLLDLN